MCILVSQGAGSDSTVSNPDLSQGELGPDTWRVKKVKMTLKLQRAKEREKALKAQISAQRERIKLEAQERENQRLESDIIQREHERLASDRDQERQDALIAEKLRLEEIAKEQKHQFEMQEARLASEFREKQARLEQALRMKELEVEQKTRELELQNRLHEMEGRCVQLSNTVQGGQTANKDMQIGSWLEGVRVGTAECINVMPVDVSGGSPWIPLIINYLVTCGGGSFTLTKFWQWGTEVHHIYAKESPQHLPISIRGKGGSC